MLNFERHYEFQFFSISDANEIILDNPDIRLSDSLNFKFNYNLMPGAFNVGKFYIYNPSEKTISLFANKNSRRGFYLRCCYFDRKNLPNSLIFRGVTNRVNTYLQGPDLIVEIDASDVFFNLTQAKIKNLNFPTGTPITTILQSISQYLGVFSGVSGTDYLTKDSYNHPITFSNISVATILDDITADCGCTWGSDTEGIKIIPLPNNKIKDSVGIITNYPTISYETGLIGNVRAENISVQLFPVDYYTQQRLVNNHPFVSATVLLRPFAYRNIVNLQSKISSLNGRYYVFSVNYSAEYRGNEWYAHLKLQPVNS